MLCLFFHISNATAVSVVPAPPAIKATSWLVMDHATGHFIVENNIDERVEPASITKMMTVYVVASELAAGNISLDDMARISKKAWQMQGSKMFIEVDKEVSVADLLKGVIIQSGNDASVALAEHLYGDEEVFVSVMNQHAARLGMNDTRFANSTGWPHPDHYTTARDLATLASALIREYPDTYRLHAEKEFTFNNIRQHNRNSLLWKDDSVDGIKTGHTESAGYCLVASATRGDMRLISVVMGTEGNNARTRATQSLLNYAFRFFETKSLFSAGEVITSNRVWKGEKDIFNLGLGNDLVVTIPRGRYGDIKTDAVVQDRVVAPVRPGDIHGELKITLDGRDIATLPLVSLDSVPPGNLLNRLGDEIRLLFE